MKEFRNEDNFDGKLQSLKSGQKSNGKGFVIICFLKQLHALIFIIILHINNKFVVKEAEYFFFQHLDQHHLVPIIYWWDTYLFITYHYQPQLSVLGWLTWIVSSILRWWFDCAWFDMWKNIIISHRYWFVECRTLEFSAMIIDFVFTEYSYVTIFSLCGKTFK